MSTSSLGIIFVCIKPKRVLIISFLLRSYGEYRCSMSLLRFSDAGEVLLSETQRRTGEPFLARYWPPRYLRWLSSQKALGKRILVAE